MKRTLIAAASLLLSTSALSGISTAADTSGKPADDADIVVNDSTNPVIAAKWAQAAAMKSATGMGGPLEEVDAGGKPADDANIVVNDPTNPVIAAKWAQAAAMKSGTGMGGPLEEANAGTVSLTPRPATTSYPPCDPGPGDDSCIQLYEPGVRAQLASWNRETGGLVDGAATNAMGGPYEPLESDIELAMNGDGVADSGVGETSDVEVAHHTTATGMGGPIESQSGYPACDPGPGDDSCIQLYERGVTGQGN